MHARRLSPDLSLPERLAADSTYDWLANVPLASSPSMKRLHLRMGHEFRPITASSAACALASPRFPSPLHRQRHAPVRHDILKQLQMRDPDLYIASFHRQNLNCIVHECDPLTQLELLAEALRYYDEGNVIVYAPTIRRVEETVEYLEEAGIPAIPYHAKWKIPCAARTGALDVRRSSRAGRTIAFASASTSLPCAVIHSRCPNRSSSIIRRRDVRAAMAACRCVLLWQKRDHVLLEYFIGKSRMRPSANDHGNASASSAASRFHRCRHRQICLHFGETPKWDRCGACDNCSGKPEWLRDHAGKGASVSRVYPDLGANLEIRAAKNSRESRPKEDFSRHERRARGVPRLRSRSRRLSSRVAPLARP